jgi:hypothetical protein
VVVLWCGVVQVVGIKATQEAAEASQPKGERLCKR